MKTRYPKDFQISHTVRFYCENRWGFPNLPDQFISEFREHFTEGDGKNKKHEDWDGTFKRWMRMNSPSGSFYSARLWEMKLEQCKPRRQKVEEYHPDEPEVPLIPKINGSEALKNIKAMLK